MKCSNYTLGCVVAINLSSFVVGSFDNWNLVTVWKWEDNNNNEEEETKKGIQYIHIYIIQIESEPLNYMIHYIDSESRSYMSCMNE